MTGGGDDSSSPYQGSYTWDNTTTASGSQTVTATNGAGSTATATFTVTNDTTAPTGQSAALSGGPWYTTLSVPLTLDNGRTRAPASTPPAASSSAPPPPSRAAPAAASAPGRR